MRLPAAWMKRLAVLAHPSPGGLARLGLACIGAVTLGFIAVCAVVLLNARRDTTAAAQMQARNVVASVAQDVARNLELYDLALQQVVRAVQTPGLAALPPELRRAVLFPRTARAPYFGFINVIDAGGTVVADSESNTPRPGYWATRDYFTAQRHDARGVLFIGEPFLKQAGESPTISISRRLSHPDGSFAGVVVGTMRLAYFRALFSTMNLGRHGTIALLRRDGMVLMRLPFDPRDIGRTLPPEAPFFRVPNGGQIDAIDPTDGLRRRFVFRPIGDFPLVVGVGLADIDIYAAWRGKAAMLGFAVAVLSLIDLCLLLVLHYALGRREAGEAALRASHDELTAVAAQRQAALTVMAQTADAKSRFLAAMSHELRTPLNSILGYAELLALEGMLAPVQAGRVAALRSAGEHLRDVIDQVLDFSRVEADERPAPLACTGLPALLAQCEAIAAPMAAAKGLAFTVTTAPDLPQHVMADAPALRQVLLNLLGNAVKFTDRGEVALQVWPGRGGIRFSVTDTGVGVPPAQRDRLFRPYERLDADRMGVPGTGLGLAITARLVERMGGRIGHRDNPGGGSVFWLELPLAPASPAPPAPQQAAPGGGRGLRVLVVDDSAMNRDIAASFLRRAGHSVVQAEDGEAALCHATAEDFDAIVMDLRMPVLDGVAATRRIRALPGRRGQVPVIAVTAQVNEDGGAALRAAGFQACLIKPIDERSFLEAVAAAGRAKDAMGGWPGEAAGLSSGGPSAAVPPPDADGPGFDAPPEGSGQDLPPSMPAIHAASPTTATHASPAMYAASATPASTHASSVTLAASATPASPGVHASPGMHAAPAMHASPATRTADAVSGTPAAEAPAAAAQAGAGADQYPDVTAHFVEQDGPRTASYRAELAVNLEHMLRLMDEPMPGAALADVVHRIAGDAGLLGHMALAAAARRYQVGVTLGRAAPADVAALRAAAQAASGALAQRNDLARRPAMTSAKLP